MVTITKEEQFHMNKERYNAFQGKVGVKIETPKHPTRKDLKKELKKELTKWMWYDIISLSNEGGNIIWKYMLITKS